MNDKLWVSLATVGPLGYAKKAPGTVGSVPGVFVGVCLQWVSSFFASSLIVYVGLIALTIVALLAIQVTEQCWGSHDDSKIVIDEVVGQAIVSSFIPLEVGVQALGFVAFRVFDILKPWPVSFFDQKVPGATGTLFDDVVAGLMGLGLILGIFYFL